MGVPPGDWDSRIGRRLKLRDLHILGTVVRCGSMAKAALQLSMSQPAVSESVANLEDVFGVRLLDRSARGVEPTGYGRALLGRADVAFDELRQGVRDIEFLANPTAGEVRVACGDTLAAGLLPAAIDQLSRRYPDVAVRVVQGNAERLEFRELRERSVDLALARIAVAFAEDDLDVELLFDDPHRVVAGACSPWARRRKVTLAQLAGERWIFPSNRVIRELVAAAFVAQGLDLPRERLTCNSILLRNHLLATGRFLTVLPVSVMRYSAKPWSLKALPIDLNVKPLSVAIVALRNRTRSPVVELFARYVRAAAKSLDSSARRASGSTR
ncbi:MAG TPA: LysR family transcriptional regulator [Usitatibacter sp.]|nr:LysR family transcriptional regulator [Usitatibacter sp.]